MSMARHARKRSNADSEDDAKPHRTLRQYTIEEKLEMVKFAKEHGNRAAAREYNAAESSVREWRKNEEKLRSYANEPDRKRMKKVPMLDQPSPAAVVMNEPPATFSSIIPEQPHSMLADFTPITTFDMAGYIDQRMINELMMHALRCRSTLLQTPVSVTIPLHSPSSSGSQSVEISPDSTKSNSPALSTSCSSSDTSSTCGSARRKSYKPMKLVQPLDE